MKRFALCVGLLLFLCSSVFAATIDPGVIEEISTENTAEVAILFDDSYMMTQEISTQNIRPKQVGTQETYVVADITAEQLENLAEDPNVLTVQSLHTLHITLEQSAEIIQAAPVHEAGYTGQASTVCVLDTGVDWTHPALGGCFGEGCTIVGGYDFVNDDAEPMDDNGHGTHVAGIIASTDETYQGVAYGANIAAVKVCNAFGGCDEATIVEGIEWCMANAEAYGITTISMSIGDASPHEDGCLPLTLLSTVIGTAYEQGLLVVAASGNNGHMTGVNWPSCATGAVSVGATTKDDTIASYTNYGPSLDLLAPGSDIFSADDDWETTDDFVSMTGTSMATPHVSAAAALFQEADPTLTHDELELLLETTGVLIEGYPRINLAAALEELLGPQGTCYDSLATLPVTCSGEIITNTYNGCRTVVCEKSESSITVLACKKTNEEGDFFEMYKQSFVGEEPTVCIGDFCMDEEGFLQSDLFPICVDDMEDPVDPPIDPPVDPPEDNESNKSNSTCAMDVNDFIVMCNGGDITSDTTTGCRTVTCTEGEGHFTVLACDKPGIQNAQYFEMYKQSATEEFPKQFEICFGPVCMTSSQGFLQSDLYPICGGEDPVDPPIDPPVDPPEDNESNETNESVVLSIAPWFPQGNHVVLICEAQDFEPTSYDWNFGDGQHQIGIPNRDVFHTYAGSGTYEVSCVARNTDTQGIGTIEVMIVE